MASLKIEQKDFEKLTLGKLTIAKYKNPERTAFGRYYSAYQRLLTYLKSKSIRRVSDAESAWFGKGLETETIIR